MTGKPFSGFLLLVVVTMTFGTLVGVCRSQNTGPCDDDTSTPKCCYKAEKVWDKIEDFEASGGEMNGDSDANTCPVTAENQRGCLVYLHPNNPLQDYSFKVERGCWDDAVHGTVGGCKDDLKAGVPHFTCALPVGAYSREAKLGNGIWKDYAKKVKDYFDQNPPTPPSDPCDKPTDNCCYEGEITHDKLDDWEASGWSIGVGNNPTCDRPIDGGCVVYFTMTDIAGRKESTKMERGCYNRTKHGDPIDVSIDQCDVVTRLPTTPPTLYCRLADGTPSNANGLDSYIKQFVVEVKNYLSGNPLPTPSEPCDNPTDNCCYEGKISHGDLKGWEDSKWKIDDGVTTSTCNITRTKGTGGCVVTFSMTDPKNWKESTQMVRGCWDSTHGTPGVDHDPNVQVCTPGKDPVLESPTYICQLKDDTKKTDPFPVPLFIEAAKEYLDPCDLPKQDCCYKGVKDWAHVDEWDDAEGTIDVGPRDPTDKCTRPDPGGCVVHFFMTAAAAWNDSIGMKRGCWVEADHGAPFTDTRSCMPRTDLQGAPTYTCRIDDGTPRDSKIGGTMYPQYVEAVKDYLDKSPIPPPCDLASQDCCYTGVMEWDHYMNWYEAEGTINVGRTPNTAICPRQNEGCAIHLSMIDPLAWEPSIRIERGCWGAKHNPPIPGTLPPPPDALCIIEPREDRFGAPTFVCRLQDGTPRNAKLHHLAYNTYRWAVHDYLMKDRREKCVHGTKVYLSFDDWLKSDGSLELDQAGFLCTQTYNKTKAWGCYAHIGYWYYDPRKVGVFRGCWDIDPVAEGIMENPLSSLQPSCAIQSSTVKNKYPWVEKPPSLSCAWHPDLPESATISDHDRHLYKKAVENYLKGQQNEIDAAAKKEAEDKKKKKGWRGGGGAQESTPKKLIIFISLCLLMT